MISWLQYSLILQGHRAYPLSASTYKSNSTVLRERQKPPRSSWYGPTERGVGNLFSPRSSLRTTWGFNASSMACSWCCFGTVRPSPSFRHYWMRFILDRWKGRAYPTGHSIGQLRLSCEDLSVIQATAGCFVKSNSAKRCLYSAMSCHCAGMYQIFKQQVAGSKRHKSIL